MLRKLDSLSSPRCAKEVSGVNAIARPHLIPFTGPGPKDGDSDAEDDDWPTLEMASAMEKRDYCEAAPVNPEDEKAIEMFMNKNPPLR